MKPINLSTVATRNLNKVSKSSALKQMEKVSCEEAVMAVVVTTTVGVGEEDLGEAVDATTTMLIGNITRSRTKNSLKLNLMKPKCRFINTNSTMLKKSCVVKSLAMMLLKYVMNSTLTRQRLTLDSLFIRLI